MLKNILLFALLVSNIGNAAVLDEIIESQCDSIPSWVVQKVITHESKSFNNGVAQPWPWTLNIDGVGYYFSSYQEALVAAVLAHKNGARRLGVGFGQIEWRYHAERFDGSFAKALTPRKNIKVVCDILKEAKQSKRVKTWSDAIAFYHRPVMDNLARQYAQTVLSF